MDFYETSACTNLNIKESFTRLTELVLQAHRKELDGLRTCASNELALAEIAKSFYDLSAIGLDGEKIDFNTFRGRAVLIENVASL